MRTLVIVTVISGAVWLASVMALAFNGVSAPVPYAAGVVIALAGGAVALAYRHRVLYLGESLRLAMALERGRSLVERDSFLDWSDEHIEAVVRRAQSLGVDIEPGQRLDVYMDRVLDRLGTYLRTEEPLGRYPKDELVQLAVDAATVRRMVGYDRYLPDSVEFAATARRDGLLASGDYDLAQRLDTALTSLVSGS